MRLAFFLLMVLLGFGGIRSTADIGFYLTKQSFAAPIVVRIR